MTDLKWCPLCRRDLPTEEFAKNRTQYDGLQSACRLHQRVWRMVYKAVQSGELVKPTRCEECGRGRRLMAHHDDYTRPLDVRWLCYQCHKELHNADL